MQAASTDQRVTVDVDQNGQYISLQEEVLSLIGGDIFGHHIVSRREVSHGYATRRTKRSLLRTADKARIPNAGCLAALRTRASQRGVDLRVRICQPVRQLPELLGENSSQFPELAGFLRRYPRGLIRRQRWIRPEAIIKDIATSYPDQRIVVLGKHIGELDRIKQVLCTQSSEVQRISSDQPVALDNFDDDMPKILLSTFLESANADLETADIVLLLNAQHCVHQRAQLALSAMDASFRLFGIITVGQRTPPSVADGIMAVFGPGVCDVYGDRKSRRQTHVAFLRHRDPKITKEPSELNYHRWCYWENEVRNRRIIQLAKKLRTDELLDRSKYPEIARWLDSRPTGLAGRKSRVTILVERPLHAVTLSKMLPDWDVYTGDTSLENLPGSFRSKANQPGNIWESGQQQIVLAAAAGSLRFAAADVVIWAGGGEYTDAIPCSWLFADDQHNRPLLIVDMDDHFNRAARAFAVTRKQSYLSRDIFPVGITPSVGRTAEFLHSRP